MSPTTSQQSVSWSPLRLWRYFSDPSTTYNNKDSGDWIPLHFLGRNFVAVLSAKGAREVFAADPARQDAFWGESLTALTGDGALWVLTGDKHRYERQLFSHAIQASHFRDYGQVICDITRYHVEKWRPGETIQAMETTRAIALDVIIRLVFGVKDEDFRREGRQILEAVWSTLHPVLVLFPRLRRPWFPLWRHYVRARSDMYDWIKRLLAVRRAGEGGEGDVLGSFLAGRDEQGEPMSDEDIRDALYTILIAGHETTATALAWALYELGRHPAEWERLREELAPLGSEPDPALVARLPYLTALCNETLRLHCPVAEVGRVLTEPMEICGHQVNPGTSLVVSIIAIHYNPELYPEPEHFIPERFIERKYSNFEFLPFGGGHRRCLGSGLAEYTMRIALAEIALRWDLESAGVDRDIRHDLAMGPKYGVPLRIKARRNPNAPK